MLAGLDFNAEKIYYFLEKQMISKSYGAPTQEAHRLVCVMITIIYKISQVVC